MENTKIIVLLGFLSVITGSALFIFNPVANTAQEISNTNELGFINFIGIILMFI